jgi:hypothetical protein
MADNFVNLSSCILQMCQATTGQAPGLRLQAPPRQQFGWLNRTYRTFGEADTRTEAQDGDLPMLDGSWSRLRRGWLILRRVSVDHGAVSADRRPSYEGLVAEDAELRATVSERWSVVEGRLDPRHVTDHGRDQGRDIAPPHGGLTASCGPSVPAQNITMMPTR